HRDHVVAVGGGEAGHVGIAVARGDHHRGAAADRAVDRTLHGTAATAAATEAEVDHLGRVGVGRHAAHAAARCPDDGIGDVGIVAAAPTKHAHRHALGVERGAGDADAVVGHRGDRACHVRSMPAGGIATVVVARVAGIGVATVAVAT